VISAALTPPANVVAGGDPVSPPGRPGSAADSPSAQSAALPGDAFLAMLVADLATEPEPAISDTTGQTQHTSDDANSLLQCGGKAPAPAKGKAKDQINELACVPSPVIPEPFLPVAACVPEIVARLSLAKTSGNQAANIRATDVLDGLPDIGPSAARPAAADGRGAPADRASDSIPIQPLTAFEALVRAPNTGNAESGEPSADSVTAAAAPSPATASLRSSSPQPVSTLSPVPVAPEAVMHRESGTAQDHSATVPNEPRPVTKPLESEAASLNEDQQPDPRDEQKQSGDDAAGAGWTETPLVLSAPTPSAAEPVSSPAPKLQPAESSTPVSAPPEVSPNVAASPARDISLQVPNPGGPRVEVQVTDRAGTVHIVVRTEDGGLTRDLRSNLPELTQKLNQQGMEAEAWSPVEMHSAAAGHENPGNSREQSEAWAGSGGFRQGSGGNPHGGQSQSEGEGPDEEFAQSFSSAFTGAASWQPVR